MAYTYLFIYIYLTLPGYRIRPTMYCTWWFSSSDHGQSRYTTHHFRTGSTKSERLEIKMQLQRESQQFPFYKTVCQIPTIDYCWASYPLPFHVYPCFVDALLSSKMVARLEKTSVCSWCTDKYRKWFWSGFLANHLYPDSWPFQLPCFL